ncbi:MAG: HupE/UreJ family protein, partial [Pseudomonadota bacterium]
ALVIMALWVGLIGMSGAQADEIPQRVSVQALVKPEGDQLNVLLRVPMDALSDIQFPVRGASGNLVFSEAGPAMRTAAESYILQNIRFYENGARLEQRETRAMRISMPSNRSFRDYQTALDNVQSPPIDDDRELYYLQGFLDVLVSYPIESGASRISVDPRLAGLGIETNTVLRYVLDDGAERAFSYEGNPGMVHLDPRWYQAAFNFIDMGFDHILGGTDHLLFLLCLVIPLRSIRALIPVITSFTIAHSVTLIAAALGWVSLAGWFPPLIEMLIALSIVYMAFENIIGINPQHRWALTFAFGLVHGFGFSFLLTDSLQFAGSHLVASLLAFNVGVELGQIAVLLVMVPVLYLFFRYVMAGRERIGIILLSALVAHEAWHWMMERYASFSAYPLQWPAFDAAFFIGLMQWLSLLLAAAGVFWMMFELFRRYFGGAESGGDDESVSGSRAALS